MHGDFQTVASVDPTASVITGYEIELGSKYFRKLIPEGALQDFPPMQKPSFMWLRVPVPKAG